MPPAPLPMSSAEMAARGWTQCDIILVTGDAYVDHPSFGVALIGRWLEHLGYKVGIIAAPDPNKVESFQVLGPPRLFWGVTAGNLDSQLARLTVMRKRRRDDPYLPEGQSDLRPPNATIVYVTRVRQAFKERIQNSEFRIQNFPDPALSPRGRGTMCRDSEPPQPPSNNITSHVSHLTSPLPLNPPPPPVIIGGIEASLRRFPYYDYWTDSVKRSILFDSKADLLVYGMAEQAIAEVAARLNRGESLSGIPGTAEIRKQESEARSQKSEVFKSQITNPLPEPSVSRPDLSLTLSCHCHVERSRSISVEPIPPEIPRHARDDKLPLCPSSTILPSFDVISTDKNAFNQMTRDVLLDAADSTHRTFIQPHGDRLLVVHPVPPPLPPDTLDTIYSLPFTRRPHPFYGKTRIGAYDMIKDSITTHRGCYGACAFCAISAHQGKTIVSRSRDNILAEIRALATSRDFHGTISDLGGPTANMYGTRCRREGANCRRASCLTPDLCPNLETNPSPQLDLWHAARALPHVNHVFITSGIRFDLALAQEPRGYIDELAKHHVCGRLKIAPEHIAANVLRLMRKPPPDAYRRFVKRFLDASRQAGKPQQVVEYFVSGHPGTTLNDMIELAQYLRRENIRAEQVQDFYPAPLTAAAAMFYTGKDPLTGDVVPVARTDNEKAMQRALLLFHDPKFHRKAREALRTAGRDDLIGNGKTCLVPPGP
jgi:uncharacterized radical SAM protein YgiQ